MVRGAQTVRARLHRGIDSGVGYAQEAVLTGTVTDSTGGVLPA